jgi:hypothetical protein
MFPIRSLASIIAFALGLGGCATLNVSSHVERGVDLSRFVTFAWGPADALPTGDPRLDNNPFFRDFLQGAVERELRARRFVYAPNGNPDLLIHYHANVNRRIEVNEVDRRYGYCGPDCPPSVIEYDQGTLVVDVVDARTNTLVWRGWAQESMEGVIDDQARLERHVDRAVKRMMVRFADSEAVRSTATSGRH